MSRQREALREGARAGNGFDIIATLSFAAIETFASAPAVFAVPSWRLPLVLGPFGGPAYCRPLWDRGWPTREHRSVCGVLFARLCTDRRVRRITGGPLRRRRYPFGFWWLVKRGAAQRRLRRPPPLSVRQLVEPGHLAGS